MRISRIILKNWRNFQQLDAELGGRVFIVGPNAAGKSNLIDAFRFLRDLAKGGGGLQEAVKNRGGVSKIRCLAARGVRADIELEIHLAEDSSHDAVWKYAIGFTQTGGGVFDVRARLKYERVWDAENHQILNRPDPQDRTDEKSLEYTFLEQPTSNAPFRDIAQFFQEIQYIHILPQLVREPSEFGKMPLREDAYGRDLIERMNKTNANTRTAHLRKIQAALSIAVPQFQSLDLIKDAMGIPHLQATYQHWRAKGARQREDQFSDGTLRLIGFLWSLLDGTKPLLLEEPEVSLHTGIITQLAEIIARLQRKKGGIRQVIVTTHSYELLSNPGIGAEEVLLLHPGNEGTMVQNAVTEEIKVLMQSGLNIGEIVIPTTAPRNIHQLALFET